MKDNLFRKSRRRLTIFYTVILTCFLIGFFFLVQWIMRLAVTSEQSHELLAAANEVAGVQRRLLPHRRLSENEKDELLNERIFFYVINNEGKILNSARAPESIEPFVLEKISEKKLRDGESDVFTRDSSGDHRERIILAAQPIKIDGEKIGTVYTGKEVTAVYWSMKKAMYWFAGVAVLAILLAAVGGYIFSGWAIVPLREAYEKQRQFAADASHELRTPLSVVMASADLLDNDPSITSPLLKQVIGDVRDEVKKMSKLVGDLLIMARRDNDALSLKTARFDLEEAVEHSLRTMKPLADKKGIILERDGGSFFVRADEQKLEQLLIILLDNAIKYTPEGGRIMVSLLKPEKGHFGFAVTDNGIGIAPGDIERIFDRFYRVDKARSREMGGNGLGLAIARELAVMHGGSIVADSEPGKGSTFTVKVKEL